MAKAGVSFKDVKTGFMYKLEAINEELGRNITLQIQEKSGTIALSEDLTTFSDELTEDMSNLTTSVNEAIDNLTNGVNQTVEDLTTSINKSMVDFKADITSGATAVADSNKFGGQPPSYYAKASEASAALASNAWSFSGSNSGTTLGSSISSNNGISYTVGTATLTISGVSRTANVIKITHNCNCNCCD